MAPNSRWRRRKQEDVGNEQTATTEEVSEQPQTQEAGTRRWRSQEHDEGCSAIVQRVDVEQTPVQGMLVEADMVELVPGFVHMKRVLSDETQSFLLQAACDTAGAKCLEPGKSAGWYRAAGSGWELNDGSKARFWDEISQFPFGCKELGEGLAKLAARRFPATLGTEATNGSFEAKVGCLNLYTLRGRMNWHVDDTNFAKPHRPIVMANLGSSADFGYKLDKSDRDRSVMLESGDVIVFGGPARNLCHALLKVHAGSAPLGLKFPQADSAIVPASTPWRVSVTWRDVGREDGLTFNSNERLGLIQGAQTLRRYLRKR